MQPDDIEDKLQQLDRQQKDGIRILKTNTLEWVKDYFDENMKCDETEMGLLSLKMTNKWTETQILLFHYQPEQQ